MLQIFLTRAGVPALTALLVLAAPLTSAGAAPPAAAQAAPEHSCGECDHWNRSQEPFRIYGNTYYVGVQGLTSLLITGSQGHILIDGALEESAPKIAASIRALGFKVEDVKLLLNSHVHFDHAGGLAALQRLSGARAAASASSRAVLASGVTGRDDPQHGSIRDIAPLKNVAVVADGETIHLGDLALQGHLTPGHTSGGTTWTWLSCEQGRCVRMVYADSLSAVSAPGYRFTAHPEVVASFERSFQTLEALPCDVLVTPHPEVSHLWDRLQQSASQSTSGTSGDQAFIDPEACRRYAAQAREGLKQRLASEHAYNP